jgi:uncharacterized membrane protein
MRGACLSMVLAALLLLLSLCGLGLSLHFTLLYYRIIQPGNWPGSWRSSRHSSQPGSSESTLLCRLSRSACEQLVFTSYGRLCILPNSVFGFAFYVLVATLAMSLLRPEDTAAVAAPPFLQGLVALLPRVLLPASLLGAAISVGAGFYLIHALFIKLRTPCVLCLLGHALNVAIACVLACITVAR